jgi:hypothetical protein
MENLAGDVARDIDGQTDQGNFGLSFQLNLLRAHHLTASFFVESLFASAVGLAPLSRIVDQIQSAQSEVQLHLHPEWLAWTDQPILPHNQREQLRHFTAAEQSTLIAAGLTNLTAAGSKTIRAFRAGDFAANRDTLTALHQNGLLYDTSYNPCYANSLADAHELTSAVQPVHIAGLHEFPVSFWKDRLGNTRHAQLCSSSSAELQGALLAAHRANWHSFIIVSHSFELLKNRRQRISNPAPDPIVVNRFKSLCRFLDDHRDKFRTCGFNDLDPGDFPETIREKPLRSPVRRTLWRVAEQAYRRLT